MIRSLRRLGYQVGRRGAFLLFLALLDLIYAYSLGWPTEQSRHTPTSRFLVEVMPLWVWAVLWGAAGLTCLVFAFRRVDWPGFMAGMLIKVGWALLFLIGWLSRQVERGYLTATIWGAFALLLLLVAGWPELPRDDEAEK